MSASIDRIVLIPVIEKWWFHDDIPSPEYPYEKHAKEWELHDQQVAALAGYTDSWVPYSAGEHVYALPDITDDNLVTFILEHTQDMHGEDGSRDNIMVFSGGFVLRTNEEDRLFPRCCCDLLSIYDWESLENSEEGYNHFNGHPAPYVFQAGDTITIDLSRTSEGTMSQGIFSPEVVLNKELLKEAIAQARKELQVFAERLIRLERERQLNIPDIDKLLVWGE